MQRPFWKKKRYWLGALLTLLPVALLLLALRDEPPPEIDDLLGHRDELPDDENGLVHLGLEEGGVVWPGWSDEELEGADGELLTEEAVDPFGSKFRVTAAEEVMRRNAALLERLERALTLRFQSPRATFLDPVLAIGEVQRLSSVLACRVRLALERADADSARADIARLLRLGRRLEESQGSLIDYLVGLAIKRRALELVPSVIARDDVGPEALRSWLAEIAGEVPSREALADTYAGEFVAFSEGLSASRSLLLLPNETRRMGAVVVRQCIEDIDKLPGERNDVDVVRRFGLTRWTSFARNFAGKRMVGLIFPTLCSLARQRDRLSADFAATRALIGLRLYHLERGALPERLEELVPVYLDAVPRDPFDGKPLRYSRERRIVYSVGGDFRDDGGAPREDPREARREHSEPTYAIPF
ncbi:MAG: hypothetical protein O7J95_22025 [Planctomycetota bacterium]|nr:hypothetical protein [Planctomycetota bacterium]